MTNVLSHNGYHTHNKRSSYKQNPIGMDYTISDPLYTLPSNWTFQWDSFPKSTASTDDQGNKLPPVESSIENGLLLDDDNILKRLSEETKTPVVFLSENNTAINTHSGTSVTLPCIIKKESKFEMVSNLSKSCYYILFVWEMTDSIMCISKLKNNMNSRSTLFALF